MRRAVRLALLLPATALALGACGDGSAPSSADSGGGTRGSIALVGPAEEGIDGVFAYRLGSAEHTEGPVTYDVVPPPGGPHHPAWANCGFHDEAIPDEHLVHDLEHGAVWLAYAPDLAPADVDALRDLVRAHDKVVAAPHDDLPSGAAVVATAWARQLVVESVDDARLERFVIQYQDGSQAPEAGVTCTGTSVGDPIP